MIQKKTKKDIKPRAYRTSFIIALESIVIVTLILKGQAITRTSIEAGFVYKYMEKKKESNKVKPSYGKFKTGQNFVLPKFFLLPIHIKS